MNKRKLTNMVWNSMAETIVFSLMLAGMMIYGLYRYGFLRQFDSWLTVVLYGLCLVGLMIAIGAAFGYWQSMRMKRRLEQMRDAMLLIEKGNLSRPIPSLGEDEIGRLGEQLGRISKKWEDQVTTLQRLSADNAELAERARYSAIVEERQRLARELHDAVSQQLFAISMTATAVGRTIDKDYDKARRQITLIEEMASAAQSEMRALLLHLRPVLLEGKQLSQALHDIVLELSEKVTTHITLTVDEDITLSKGMEDHLFRIVQESLSNTLRHAKADRMDIKLQRKNDLVRLTIWDDGVGFELDHGKLTSYGLKSMHERINEIGGAITFITAPGKGTRIDIRVPITSRGGIGDNDGISGNQSVID